MRGCFKTLLAAAASAAVMAGASMATAQPAPPPAAPAADQAPVDPAKLALARKLLDMQMGQMNLPQLLKSIDNQMLSQVMKQQPGVDEEKQRRIQAAVEKVQAEMLPKMMDGMAAAFARNLTDQELQDTVAFYSSPSGQAILHKMPAIMTEAMSGVDQWLPRIRHDVIEAVCADNGCTPAQREAMERQAGAGAPPPPQ
jgi:hypothetical protein